MDWCQVHQQYESYVEEEKQLKQEKKEFSAYTRATFIRKAEKDPKLMQKYDLAVSQIEKIELQLRKTAALRRVAKKSSDKLKNKAMKYEVLQQEMLDISFPKEEELYQQALKKAKEYQELFPHFYLEIQYHGMPEEKYVMERLYHISRELQIPLIAANDAHMASKGDEVTRQILRYNYFESHQEISDADKELYVKSEEEMREALLQVIPPDAVEEAIKNTSILNECHVEIPQNNHYPKCRQ